MKLLTFTTLYPDDERPRHGIFVENRLRKLVETREIQSKVVAPVPWFPFQHQLFGSYGRFAKIKKWHRRHDIEVYRPRYLLLPKIGMNITPFTLALSGYLGIRKRQKKGERIDVIDAHYFYPDGVAAVMIAKLLGIPVVVTARGTDINLFPKFYVARMLIKWAAHHASAIISVSAALKHELLKLGVEENKITVLRNGVDLQQFRPVKNRDAVRAKLGVNGKVLLSVGNLIELKGHALVIQAMADISGAMLLIAGDGPLRSELQQLAKKLNLQDRVKFLGNIEHQHLREYYAAADAMVLASSREGWANVLLESMACGTPVVATNVGGTPEVITAKEAGLLIEKRNVESIRNTILQLLNNYPVRTETRHYAEKFSWDHTTQGQLDIFSRVTKKTQQ